VLRKLGFALHRESVLVVVPRHPGDLATGAFHGILRQAGLSKADYVKLR
jgi:predicted RNA binding protein YcfA (HicA-like mRNA interferase family)